MRRLCALLGLLAVAGHAATSVEPQRQVMPPHRAAPKIHRAPQPQKKRRAPQPQKKRRAPQPQKKRRAPQPPGHQLGETAAGSFSNDIRRSSGPPEFERNSAMRGGNATPAATDSPLYDTVANDSGENASSNDDAVPQYSLVNIPGLHDVDPDCANRLATSSAKLEDVKNQTIIKQYGTLLTLMILPLSDSECGSDSFVDDILDVWASLHNVPAGSEECALFRGLSLQAFAASVPQVLRDFAWGKGVLPPPVEADTCLTAIFEQINVVSVTDEMCAGLATRAESAGGGVNLPLFRSKAAQLAANRRACLLIPAPELFFYVGFQHFIVKRIIEEEAQCENPEKVNTKLTKFRNAIIFDSKTMSAVASLAASALSSGRCSLVFDLGSMLIQYQEDVALDRFKLITYSLPIKW